MLPHQFNTGPSFDRSFSYVPSSSFPRYNSKVSSPSPFITRSVRDTPSGRTKTIANSPNGCLKHNVSLDSNSSQLASSIKEQARLAVPLSYDEVLSKLKPLRDGVPGQRKISIKGVSADVVNMLREKGREESGDWKNLWYRWLFFFYFSKSDKY